MKGKGWRGLKDEAMTLTYIMYDVKTVLVYWMHALPLRAQMRPYMHAPTHTSQI